MGSFTDRMNYELNTASGDNYGIGVYLPALSSPHDIPGDLVERFNINSQVIYSTTICASSPLFRYIARQEYSDLVNSDIGNLTQNLETSGSYYCK